MTFQPSKKGILYLVFIALFSLGISGDFSYDSYYFLRLARDFNGIGSFDYLRVWPEGNFFNNTYFSMFLAGLNNFSGGKNLEIFAEMMTYVLTFLIFYFVFYAICLLGGSEDDGFLACMLLMVIPWFSGFLYFDTHLVEIFFFLLGSITLIFFFKTKEHFFGILGFLAGIIFFFTRPLSFSFVRMHELSNFGVGELHSFLGLPVRAYFFLFPLIFIVFFGFFSRRIKKEWKIVLVVLLVLFNIFGYLLPERSIVRSESFQEASKFLNNSEHGVILDWWDLGYAWQYKTKKPTFWDGGTFHILNGDHIAKFYLSPVNESFEILKTLTRGRNETVYVVVNSDFQNLIYLLERRSNRKYDSESLLYKMLSQQKIAGMDDFFVSKKQPTFIVYKIK